MLSFLGHPRLAMGYKYDSVNRLIEKTYPTERGEGNPPIADIRYSYGIRGLLSDLTIDGSEYVSGMRYNAAEQATSLIIGPTGPAQTSETSRFDPNTGLVRQQKARAGQSALLQLTYNYYPGGQLSELVDELKQSGHRSYKYDSLGR